MVRTALVAYLALVLGLTLPDSLDAQDIARLQSGVVKIRAKPAEGGPKVGTGFIVRLEKDVAYIVTSTHVVAGDSDPKVEFFTKKNRPVPAEVLGLEGGDEIRGLALLLVKGQENLPNGLTALPLASATPAEGMEIMVIGFPRSQGPWAVAMGNISSRQGRDLYFSPAVDEGYSGGPIMQSGKVIGMVGGTSQTVGRGVTVRSVQDYVEGFEITAQESATSGTSEKAQETKPPTVAKVLPTPSFPMMPETRETGGGREVTGKDGAPMVLIPAGEFWMGSPDGEGDKDEHPRHRVYLDTFYLDKYEVTNKRFEQFVRDTTHRTTAEREGNAYALTSVGKWEKVSGANWRKPEGGDTVFVSNREEHPVVSVSWEDAESYCRWAGKRLPTEAEFEYATRGGTETKYWWGNGIPGSRQAANIADESAKRQYSDWTIMTGYDDGHVRTAPVGSYEANRFGLYDMIGNVWEWTADWYDEHYYEKSQKRNPTGPSAGTYKVLRGGSWYNGPDYVRSAYRDRYTPSNRDVTLGFRCAQDAPQ